MKKLAKYNKISNKIKELEEEKNNLRNEIIEEIKNIEGRNEDKKLIEDGYEAQITYKRTIKWNTNEAKKFFQKVGYDKVIKEKITFDNKEIDNLINNEKIDKNKIDSLRSISWNSPMLFVNKMGEK